MEGENKIEIPMATLPSSQEEVEKQRKYIKKIYKAVFRALKTNCNCEVCQIMRELSDFIEDNI